MVEESKLEEMEIKQENLKKKYFDYFITKAYFYQVLGEQYQNKRKNSESIKYFQKQLDILQQLYGNRSIQCLNLFSNLGQLFQEEEDIQKSIFYYEQQMSCIEKAYGLYSIDLCDTLLKIGDLYNFQGNIEKSLQNLQRCLYITEQSLGLNCEQYSVVINKLFHIQKNQQNQQQFKEEWKIKFKTYLEDYNKLQSQIYNGQSIYEILTNSIKLYGQNSRKLLEVLENIDIKNFPKQNIFYYYITLLHIQEHIYGQESFETVKTYENLGDWSSNSYYYYSVCLQKIQGRYGKNCEESFEIILKIGKFFQDNCKFEISITYYNDALYILELKYGKRCVEALDVLNKLGICYIELKRKDKFNSLFLNIISIYEQSVETKKMEILNSLKQVACQSYQYSHYNSSIEYSFLCIDLYEKQHGAKCLESLELLKNIGDCYIQLRQYDIPGTYFQKIIQILKEQKGIPPQDLKFLHQIEKLQGNRPINSYQKSIDIFLYCLEIYQLNYGKGCLEQEYPLLKIVDGYSNYCKQYDKAEQFCIQYIQICRERYKEEPEQLYHIYMELGDILGRSLNTSESLIGIGLECLQSSLEISENKLSLDSSFLTIYQLNEFFRIQPYYFQRKNLQCNVQCVKTIHLQQIIIQYEELYQNQFKYLQSYKYPQQHNYLGQNKRFSFFLTFTKKIQILVSKKMNIKFQNQLIDTSHQFLPLYQILFKSLKNIPQCQEIFFRIYFMSLKSLNQFKKNFDFIQGIFENRLDQSENSIVPVEYRVEQTKETILYSILGHLQYEQQHYDKAIQTLQKIEKYQEISEDMEWIKVANLQAIGLTFSKKKNYKEAQKYLQESLEQIKNKFPLFSSGQKFDIEEEKPQKSQIFTRIHSILYANALQILGDMLYVQQ